MEPRVSEALAATSRKHSLDLKGAGRDQSMSEFANFVEERAPGQLTALLRPLGADTTARVVCVRHGMGHHNDGFETASFMNRDSELNRIGQAQATHAGELLRAVGLLDAPQKTLVVISPMRRTLQTALLLLGADEWQCPTIVQPLAAETNVSSRFRAPGLIKHLVSAVQQGDHGSTAAELRQQFPAARHPQFDFSTVDRYCEEMGSRWAPGGAEEGKWWHHGHNGGIESRQEDAQARSAALRTWLASEAARRNASTVLLISHGGMLKQTFATDSFANSEFRVFDLLVSGELRPCESVPHPLTSG